MTHKTELMEELRIAAGATYISDLRDPSMKQHLREAVASVPADSHSDECWRMLAEYLLNLEFDGGAAEIKRELLILL